MSLQAGALPTLLVARLLCMFMYTLTCGNITPVQAFWKFDVDTFACTMYTYIFLVLLFCHSLCISGLFVCMYVYCRLYWNSCKYLHYLTKLRKRQLVGQQANGRPHSQCTEVNRVREREGEREMNIVVEAKGAKGIQNCTLWPTLRMFGDVLRSDRNFLEPTNEIFSQKL